VAIKLTGITNPSIEIELPDGTKKVLDLWEIADKMESEGRKAREAAQQGTFVSAWDVTRLAFGFPTEAEAQASGAFTPNQQMCQVLRAGHNDAVEAQPETKKILGMPLK
jgi:hypothetical protein